MKKYIVYLILCFVSCFIFSCTSVYEKGDTSCIPEGMERLTFKVIVSSSKVVGSNTRSTALEKENQVLKEQNKALDARLKAVEAKLK